jgi:succinate dehydrogenase (ubiquinone) cytochrome b560 subunit
VSNRCPPPPATRRSPRHGPLYPSRERPPKAQFDADHHAHNRPVTTSKLTESDAQSLLAAQRRQRPVSPHLQVYDYAQTYFGSSIWTRITGSIFSGGLYVFATAYLAAPLLGWHLESAALAEAFGALPAAVKGGLKFLVAWPFSFHCINGIRHLIWDTATGFDKAGINTIGNIVFGAAITMALGLAFVL